MFDVLKINGNIQFIYYQITLHFGNMNKPKGVDIEWVVKLIDRSLSDKLKLQDYKI